MKADSKSKMKFSRKIPLILYLALQNMKDDLLHADTSMRRHSDDSMFRSFDYLTRRIIELEN